MVSPIAPRRPLDVEAEMHDVTLAHNVHLTLEPQPPGLAGAGFATVVEVIVECDHLGANEAALEIGVNHAGGLRCGAADAHRPGPHFLRPRGEISQQAE